MFWCGGKLPRPGYLHPPGGGGELRRVRAYPGVSSPWRGDKLHKGRSTPLGRVERASYPGFKIRFHRFVFICTHCSLVHARVHVHSYVLVYILSPYYVIIMFLYINLSCEKNIRGWGVPIHFHTDSYGSVLVPSPPPPPPFYFFHNLNLCREP